jgi:hypothetical protein
MKLITNEIKKRFKAVGSQENEEDPIVIAKFFSPVGCATWLATEYNEEDKICFGVASLFPGEWEFGYFSIKELEEVKLPLGLKVERDLYAKEERLSFYKKLYNF